MVIWVINMAIMGIQLNGIHKTSSVVLHSYQLDLPFRHYPHYCDFEILTPVLTMIFLEAHFAQNGASYEETVVEVYS